MHPTRPSGSRSVARRRVAVAAAAALLATAPAALATDCTLEAGSSTCLDADTLWLRPLPGRFVALGAHVPASGRGGLSIHAGHLVAPIRVVAASPDPSGRELGAVDSVTGVTVGGAYVPFERFSVGLAVPAVLHQTGTGLSGITGRELVALEPTVLRDPRLHFAVDVLPAPNAGGLGVVAGLDALVPLGASGSFAGERGFAASPWAAALLHQGVWFAGLELGARLRPSVPIAGMSIGSQGSVALGTGVRSGDDAFGIAVEARALPNLGGTTRETPDGTRVAELPVPSEWMLNGWASLAPDLVVTLGFGGGIPFGRRTLRPPGGEAETEWITAPTTPSFRGLVGIRWVFGADPSEAAEGRAVRAGGAHR
jgi:hypothetical protein